MTCLLKGSNINHPDPYITAFSKAIDWGSSYLIEVHGTRMVVLAELD